MPSAGGLQIHHHHDLTCLPGLGEYHHLGLVFLHCPCFPKLKLWGGGELTGVAVFWESLLSLMLLFFSKHGIFLGVGGFFSAVVHFGGDLLFLEYLLRAAVNF